MTGNHEKAASYYHRHRYRLVASYPASMHWWPTYYFECSSCGRGVMMSKTYFWAGEPDK